jgi:hypothetical protein
MGVSLPLCCFSGRNTLLSGWMGHYLLIVGC